MEGFVACELLSWLLGGWACILAALAFAVSLSSEIPVALPEVERPYVECDGVPFYGTFGECLFVHGGRSARIVGWQPGGASFPVEHPRYPE